MNVYMWDEIDCAVACTPVQADTLPQAADLLDIEAMKESGPDAGLVNRTLRMVGDVVVISGQFGLGKECRLYAGPGAEALAEAELQQFMNEE